LASSLLWVSAKDFVEEERVTLQVRCRTVGGEGNVMELHGWLSGPEISEFKAACACRNLPLRIDLEQLAGASPDGILALREQRARGARLEGASPYIQLLLQSVNSSASEERDRQ